MNGLETFTSLLNIIRTSNVLTIRQKQSILETAYAGVSNGNNWKVIGISEACYYSLKEYNFTKAAYIAIKPVRAHLFQRRETAINVLNSNMSPIEAIEYISSRDICYLTLRSENKKDVTVKSIVDIPQDIQVFKSTDCGYVYSNKEVEYLQSIAL